MRKLNDFIWETHGIHAGTENDHVKHGIDKLEDIVDKAIEHGHPSITFIIHSPRLTNFRYTAEKNTNIKFSILSCPPLPNFKLFGWGIPS